MDRLSCARAPRQDQSPEQLAARQLAQRVARAREGILEGRGGMKTIRQEMLAPKIISVYRDKKVTRVVARDIDEVAGERLTCDGEKGHVETSNEKRAMDAIPQLRRVIYGAGGLTEQQEAAIQAGQLRRAQEILNFIHRPVRR
mmetsp:Transcript_63753/g.170821  ORF Transcript_63753/g.170821 Transcript_63753/m.170821 type:complete len:143 (+) Transcript_63753:423-851(+)